MKQDKMNHYAALLLLLVVFSACKKVINIKLNSSATKYVVEGNVTNQAPPYLVSITQTVNFNQNNVFPGVSGATVVITDVTAGQTDTLSAASAGNYYTNIITGVPGHTYQLYVNAANNVFTASCTMPQPVLLDSVYTQGAPFGNDREVIPVYTDPVALGNYYHFDLFRNDTLTTGVYARNDALINGQVVTLPLNGGNDDSVKAGDSITVVLECIDSAMYQYYYTLDQTENQNSATPSNPLTNLTGGALGYFSAHTYSAKSNIAR